MSEGGAWLSPLRVAVNRTVTAHVRDVDGQHVVDALVLIDPDITAATLREVPFSRLAAASRQGHELPGDVADAISGALAAALTHTTAGPPRPDPERSKLTRPDGTDPAGFSRRVALAYGEALPKTSSPAKLLAKEADVPVTTVHRWVRDARRLGFLPPARKGRAG